MITRKSLRNASALYSFLLFPIVRCHMEMSWPYALRSKFNPANSYQIIDYSMTTPLSADGSNYPCKGYQNDGAVSPVVTYTAGTTYNMSLSGSATHGGGSCQLSLSYDNGATFRVIKSMIGGCPLSSTYGFKVPVDAPGGSALLAWSWQNFQGNREFYMNCAQVSIVSPTRRRRRRQSYESFDNLPYIWRANLAGITNCTTAEGESPVYPNPGADVEYSGGMSSSDLPTPGDCDTGPTTGDNSKPPPSNLAQDPDVPYTALSAPTSNYVAPVENEVASPWETYEETPSPTEAAAVLYDASSSPMQPSTDTKGYMDDTSQNDKLRQAVVSSQPHSTTTLYVDCPNTITITVYPPSSTRTVTLRSISRSHGQSYTRSTSRSYSHSTSRVYPRPTSPRPYSARSTVHATHTATVVPVPPSGSGGSSGHPPYASGNMDRYLPCVPGTFICRSATSWDTCAYDSAGNWVYSYTRTVAAGMQCVAFNMPNSGSQHGQQGESPPGYHRDDRIVRARPYGDCRPNGSIRCTRGGQMFQVCDQGGWVHMGRVAQGTTCSNGHIS